MSHNSCKFACTLSPINYGTSRDLWLSLEKGYAPHSTSREYTLKTQLLRIEMQCDEIPNAYMNRAQEYVDTLAAIGEPVKNTYLVMLIVLGLREEYNGLKTTITSRQSPTAFSKLHALLSDHDYMLAKTNAPASSITPSFATNYVVGSPSMTEPPIIANNHVTPDLAAMDTLETYYGDDALLLATNVQTDWGGEFCNLAPFFSSLGIIHRRSCSHTSEQNRFVERRNRHVVETGLTLLAQSCVPQRFWQYAFNIVVYLINTTLFLVPMFSSSSSIQDFRSTLCIFLGYNPSHHGYRCLDISTERLYIARHVRINEARFPFDIPNTTFPPSSKTSYYSLESPYVIRTTDHPSPSSPNSPISSPSSVSQLSPTSQTSPESSTGQPSPISTTSIPTPLPSPPTTASHHSATSCKSWSKSQTTGSLQSFRRSCYRLKQDKNGAITRYKARVVAKGCQYMHAPTENHWSAVKRILRYLHSTVDHGMLLRRSSGSTIQAFTGVLWKGSPDTSLEAFLDADWAGDSDDRQPTEGIAIYLGLNLISWTAHK
nr:nucleotide-binding, alpha-beta plait [Tanacetum cinerariifolium]